METTSDYLITQGLFLKAIACVYLIAFSSLLVQVKGLYGENGIVPIKNFLQRARENNAENVWIFFKLPTLFWIGASDRALIISCWAGIGLSVMAIVGWYPALAFIGLWILYYSFVSTGYPFLNFQWDVLLLEVGFLAFLFAIQSPPPLMTLYLLWFLLFRFLFSSGLSKLILGSKEWRDLTAMDYHFETQPLPTKLGYYAHYQPKFFSKLSTLGTYFFEIVVPLFIFSPIPMRFIVFCLCVLFQVLIILTGNFAFFNILSIAMCIPLLPDSYLEGFRSLASFTPLFGDNVYIYSFLTVVSVGFFILNVFELLTTYINMRNLQRVLYFFNMYNLINSYGLFLHMTTYRDEIVIEGSDDGKNWLEYPFKWKPSYPSISPKFVAPHQPRLDWQCWFATLSDRRRNLWLVQLLIRLLEGAPDTIKLMGKNPFPDHPPRFIRAMIYRYHFNDLKTKSKTGRWWSRKLIGNYTPVYTLEL